MRVCFFLWIFWILFIQAITLSRLTAQPFSEEPLSGQSHAVWPLSGQPFSGQPYSGQPLRILWYNTENLFHPSDDSVAGDDEFTPGGIRNWNDFRYHKKLTSLAKVIVAAGGWEPPEVVGLCEVENRRVLEELSAHPLLEHSGYQVIHRDGPDSRGTEVACLCREQRVGVGRWHTVPSVLAGMGEQTRDLLCLELKWGRDTFDLVLVHLISKYGGEGVTAMPRREQVLQLLGMLDSMQRSHPGRWRIVAGDFNDPPDAYSMEPVRQRRDSTPALTQVPLTGAPGTYKYRGQWATIDQFLISAGSKKFQAEARILALPPLLVPDASDGGVKPFRTYQGPLYQAGISDHLPVLLEIRRPDFPWGGGR